MWKFIFIQTQRNLFIIAALYTIYLSSLYVRMCISQNSTTHEDFDMVNLLAQVFTPETAASKLCDAMTLLDLLVFLMKCRAQIIPLNV